MSQIIRGHTNHRAGASHPKARLTDKQVKEIREIYATGGIGYGFLADHFKCGASTVRDIVQYRTRWTA